MSGHSILYLGRGEFAADYLGELETLPSCTYLTRSATLELPALCLSENSRQRL